MPVPLLRMGERIGAAETGALQWCWVAVGGTLALDSRDFCAKILGGTGDIRTESQGDSFSKGPWVSSRVKAYLNSILRPLGLPKG